MEIKEYDVSAEALQGKQYAQLTTEKGSVWIKLFPKDAPTTVANFAHLVESGFYDGLNFHRVIPGFMAQGGCPDGVGTGGPGWRIKCELDDNPQIHTRGALSMAHAGRNTGGSQFFITFVPCPHLDGEHTVFGHIEKDDEESFKVLDSIAQGDKIVKIEIKESRA